MANGGCVKLEDEAGNPITSPLEFCRRQDGNSLTLKPSASNTAPVKIEFIGGYSRGTFKSKPRGDILLPPGGGPQVLELIDDLGLRERTLPCTFADSDPEFQWKVDYETEPPECSHDSHTVIIIEC